MAYRCVAMSAAGFVQQLAVAYLAHGYWFYVTGRVPEGKDPAEVDRKLIARYEVGISKWARSRQKRQGRARVQYLRFVRFFVLLATHGEHPFFAEEGKEVRDVRRRPILFVGYAIGGRKRRSSGKWHPSVRIERTRFRELSRRFEAAACHSMDVIESAWARLGRAARRPRLAAIRHATACWVTHGRSTLWVRLLPVRAKFPRSPKKTPPDSTGWLGLRAVGASRPPRPMEPFASGKRGAERADHLDSRTWRARLDDVGRRLDFSPEFSSDGTTLAAGSFTPGGRPISFWHAPSLAEIDERIRTGRINR